MRSQFRNAPQAVALRINPTAPARSLHKNRHVSAQKKNTAQAAERRIVNPLWAINIGMAIFFLATAALMAAG